MPKTLDLLWWCITSPALIKYWRRSLLLATAVALLAIPGQAGGRTDVIYMKNGDKLTGEIRLVANGMLQFKTDYGSGRFNIFWDEIERIETTEVISVELSSGERIRGLMVTSPSGEMEVKDQNGNSATFELPEVAWMHEGGAGFLGRFDGNMDLGYSLAKSNSTQQFTLNGSLMYNADRYTSTASVGVLFSSQDGASTTQRYQGALTVRRLIGDKWFALGGFDALHSDELELDLRSTLGGGIGRYLRRDYQYQFSVGGGGVWNREIYFNPEIPNQNSPEAVAIADFNVYNLVGNNLNLINELKFYKSLSRGSRTRLDLHMEVQWSLPKHLYYNITFADNFDSSPIGRTPGNDFVFSTGFGWSP